MIVYCREMSKQLNANRTLLVTARNLLRETEEGLETEIHLRGRLRRL